MAKVISTTSGSGASSPSRLPLKLTVPVVMSDHQCYWLGVEWLDPNGYGADVHTSANITPLFTDIRFGPFLSRYSFFPDVRVLYLPLVENNLEHRIFREVAS